MNEPDMRQLDELEDPVQAKHEQKQAERDQLAYQAWTPNLVDLDFYYQGCYLGSVQGSLRQKRLLIETHRIKGKTAEEWRLWLEVLLLTYPTVLIQLEVPTKEVPKWLETGARKGITDEEHEVTEFTLSLYHYRPLSDGWMMPRRFYNQCIQVRHYPI